MFLNTMAALRPIVSTNWMKSSSLRRLHVTQIKLFDRDVESSSFFSNSKKYYIDVKESSSGKYLKISEMSRGKRFTLMVNGVDVDNFQKSLDESNVKGASTFTTNNNINYSVEKKRNNSGDFYQCLEKHPDGRVHRLIIPDESLGSIQSILKQYQAMHFDQVSTEPKNP